MIFVTYAMSCFLNDILASANQKATAFRYMAGKTLKCASLKLRTNEILTYQPL